MPDFIGTHRIDSPIHGEAEITNRHLVPLVSGQQASTTKNGYDSQLNESYNQTRQPADLPWNVNDQAPGGKR